MVAEWTRLPPETRETCASVSCGHAPASWRMDAGDVGSWFCEPCRVKIMKRDLMERDIAERKAYLVQQQANAAKLREQNGE